MQFRGVPTMTDDGTETDSDKKTQGVQFYPR